MNWLIELFNKLTCFIPRIWLVAPDEAGVRVTGGYHYSPTPPGWYVYWPIVQVCDKIKVKTQIIDLRPQSLWTLDKQNIIVSGSIRYRITDAVKALLEVQDYDETIVTLALGVIFDFTKSKALQDIQVDDLRREILSGLRKEAQGWGLKIEAVYLTDFGTTRNIRILGNIPTAMNIGDMFDVQT